MLNRVFRLEEWQVDTAGLGNFLNQTFKYQWLEVFLLALGIPLLKLAVGLQDPFFLQTAFPWLLLPLLLIALRYGTVTAMSGFGLLLFGTVLYAGQSSELTLDAAHLQQLAGMSIILLLVGELAGRWQQRYQEGQAHIHSLHSDMTQVERELQVLQVSHAQLEEELLGVGHSLKRSLDIVRDNLPVHLPRAVRNAWLIDKMMEILSTYDWLDSAAFLAVDKNNRLSLKPLTEKGSLSQLQQDDRLLQEVLRTKKPVGFKRDIYLAHANATLGSNLIAVLPVLDKNAGLQMVLVVQHIQFAAYTQKNLNLLVTLCTWLGNLLPTNALEQVQGNARGNIAGLSAVADEIHASFNLFMEHKRTLALLIVSIPQGKQLSHYADYFVGLAYGSNRLWQLLDSGRTILILALPASHPEQFDRYQQRVEMNFHQRFGRTLAAAGIGLFAKHIRQSPKKQQLIEYLRLIK